jgi:hypothetical protein
LDYVAITIEILDSKGGYLGNSYTNELKVRPDQWFMEEIRFQNVKVGEIASWRSALKVNVNLPNADNQEAISHFKLHETLAREDRKPSKRLEDFLRGHWREGPTGNPLTRAGEYFLSSASPEAVRVDNTGDRLKFSVDVQERNYSTGTVKVRLLNPTLGLQFDSAPVDEKTLRTQLTDIAPDGNRFQEVGSRLQSKFTSNWKWIDKRDQP